VTIPFPLDHVPISRRPRIAWFRRTRILTLLVTGYVALLPYQFEVGKRMNFAPADCLLLLILLLAAGQLKYRKPAWTVWHLGIVTTFAVGSLVAALSFGQLSSYEWVNKDAGLILPFLSYAAITTAVIEWEDLRRILRIFTLSVMFENFLAVGAFLGAYFFGIANPFARYGPRLSGMLLDPNAYGGLLVVALVVCEGASWGQAPLFKRPTLWMARITLALGILFTFSRSAWTGLGFALVLFCAIRPAVAVRTIGAGLIGAPLLMLGMGRHFWPFFQEMASRPQQVQQRFDLIERALQSFARDPWLGGGLGSFRLGAGEVAHNSAMWFLADFGVLGLAALIGFLAWFFAKGWFSYRLAPEREKPLALALLLAHAAMLGLAMGIEAFYQRHWWLVFGLIASSYCITLRPARPRAAKPEVSAHAHS
jgi:putative inorganic carbon (HCO3(-)) transporter